MEAALHRFLVYLRDVRGSSANTLLAYRADLRQLVAALRPKVERPEDLTQEALADDVVLVGAARVHLGPGGGQSPPPPPPLQPPARAPAEGRRPVSQRGGGAVFFPRRDSA